MSFFDMELENPLGGKMEFTFHTRKVVELLVMDLICFQGRKLRWTTITRWGCTDDCI